MGQYAVKVRCDDRDFYIHWSEIVDAPVFVAVSLDDYRAYFQRRFGTDAASSWEHGGHWERLETRGVSTFHYDSPGRAMRCNRAGPDEEELSFEGIIEQYCRGRTESSTV